MYILWYDSIRAVIYRVNVYRHHDLITGWILIINHQIFTDCLGCTVYKIQYLKLAKSLSHYHGYWKFSFALWEKLKFKNWGVDLWTDIYIVFLYTVQKVYNWRQFTVWYNYVENKL